MFYRFPGMEESTFLSRSFADQGLKIRIRKELRQRRKLATDNNTSEKDKRPKVTTSNGTYPSPAFMQPQFNTNHHIIYPQTTNNFASSSQKK